MEKRFLLFLTLSMMVMAGYLMLQATLAPPPAPPGENPPVEQAEDLGLASDPTGQDVPGPRDQPPRPVAAESAEPSEVAGDDAPAVRPAPKQVWTTLEAPGSPLRVRLTNQSAGIDHIELVEKDAKGRLLYRALDDDRPYLGALVLEDAVMDGVLVRYVPPNSPASLAGLRADDIIVSVGVPDGGEDTVVSEAEFQRLLGKKYKRAATVLLGVAPGGDRDATKSLSVAAEERPFALLREDRDAEGRLTPTPTAFRVALASIGRRELRPKDPAAAALLDLVDGHWEMPGVTNADSAAPEDAPSDPTSATFSYQLSSAELKPFGVEGPITVNKRFRLAGGDDSSQPNHHLMMDVSFKNEGGQPVELAYAIYGSSGLSTEGWWYQNKLHTAMFSAAGARDVVVLDQYNTYRIIGTREMHSQAKQDPNSPAIVLFAEDEEASSRTVSALAGDIQYFSVAMIPPDFAAEGRQTMEFARAEALALGPPLTDRYRLKLQNNSFRVVTLSKTIPAGQELNEQFAVFCGPKKPALLLQYNLEHLIYQGWFAVFSQLAGMLLHGFYAVIRNYGLAIILLTVLVRGAMYPLGRKAAMNAKKMQELAPEVKVINEKYKNDMQKRSEEIGKLYKSHNFNPMSGCGVMFLQLPVFLGLYRCLAVDINLRQAALIPGAEWCSNLAGPDQLWNWSDYLPEFLAGEGAGYLGPYLNVLPIITIGLFLVQQKLFTPPPTDEQSRMQQQMMKYMMVFFCVMFFRVPAGLCIYFIASSIWGIAERKLLPNTPPGGGGGSGGKPTKQELETKQTIEAKKARKKAQRRR